MWGWADFLRNIARKSFPNATNAVSYRSLRKEKNRDKQRGPRFLEFLADLGDESAMRSSLPPESANDGDKKSAITRYECKTCWYIYDPKTGDEEHQISAGTPFSSLSESWKCPICHGPKEDFLPIEE